MTATLAVDGGQSGIRLRHSLVGGIVEVAGVSRLGDPVAAVVSEIRGAILSSGFPAIDRVVLGLTTAPVLESEASRLCALVSSVTGASEVWIADDTVTAHCGALSGGFGISLITGTGVASLAVSATRPARAFDGHGYLLGDEGGAFWIGRRALGQVLRSRDRDRSSALTHLATDRYGDLDQLHVQLHDAVSPVNEIAQFARDVLAAAEEDEDCAAILDEAAALLLATVRAGAEYLDEPLTPLALGGKMLDPASALRLRVDALLVDEPGIAPRSADADPIAGCLLLSESGAVAHYENLIFCWREGNAP